MSVSSTALPSSPADTVTVWRALHVVVVNVRVFWSPDAVDVSTVTAPDAPETVTVTVALGWVFRRTRYRPLPFSSTSKVVGVTCRLGVSLSVEVATSAAVGTPPWSAPDAAWVNVTVSLSPSKSFAAVIRTVRAVSQLPAVKNSRVGLAERPSAAPVMSTVTPPPTGSVASRTV